MKQQKQNSLKSLRLQDVPFIGEKEAADLNYG